MNNTCGSNGHYHKNKGQEQCRVSGRSNVAPRDKKSRRSYQAQRFQLIYTQYLVFGIDTHNDAANTDTPTQILLSMQLEAAWYWLLR